MREEEIMERKDQIKAFMDRFYKSGDTSTKDLMPTGLSPFEQALEARDIQQSALASELSNMFDIAPVEKGDSIAKAEQKMMDKLQKNYPDMKGVDLKIRKRLAESQGARGIYIPDDKLIELDHDWLKYDPAVTEGSFFHEGSHAYDHLKQGYVPEKNIEKSVMQKSPKAFKDLDPTEAYELINSKVGHHKYIPEFREGSVGLGGLKALAKHGKRLAVSAPLIGGAISAAMSGDASAAIPLLGEADEVGKGSDIVNSDDSRMVEQASQNAADPNIRKMAIQELRNRNR